MTLWVLLVVFVVTTLVGYKVISDVPSLLHTPLMSGMNALSGITVVGALAATAAAVALSSALLGALAIVLATINVVGGFVVTERMLRMFRDRKQERT
jgi:NAD(P) transhydrogenase subunit alpha